MTRKPPARMIQPPMICRSVSDSWSSSTAKTVENSGIVKRRQLAVPLMQLEGIQVDEETH
jgi:hypothetical protein